MAKLLKLLLILAPVIEIVGMLLVSDEIGVGQTLLLLLAGFAVGVIVIRWLGAAAFRDYLRAVREGAPPVQALRASAVTLGAGVLFIIPGFVSDLVALLLLMRAAYLWVRQPRRASPDPSGAEPFGAGRPSAGMPEQAKIVDAEFVIVEKDPRPTGASASGAPTREAP